VVAYLSLEAMVNHFLLSIDESQEGAHGRQHAFANVISTVKQIYLFSAPRAHNRGGEE
jgi:hypothetical protein